MRAYVQQVDTGETIFSEHNTREEALEETGQSAGDLVRFALTRGLAINVYATADGEVAATMSDSSEWRFWVE